MGVNPAILRTVSKLSKLQGDIVLSYFNGFDAFLIELMVLVVRLMLVIL